MNGKRALIVGAGIGGLTAAMRLAHAGLEVDVYEKQPGPGGRCGRVEFDGFRFDLGPTILLMPHVLQEVWASVGRKLEDYLKIQRCDPHYLVHYLDGSRFTLWSDPPRMDAELERLEPGSARRYRDFLRDGRTQHDTAFASFVTRHFDSVAQFLAPRNVPSLFQAGAHRRLWSHVSRYFKDPRILQALSFQSMYLGLSPMDAPSTFSLLPYTEAEHGIWFPEGGLHAVALALEQVCREEGVRFHYQTPVRSVVVENGAATGLELEGGQLRRGDLVLCNADHAWGVEHLLPQPLAARRSAQIQRKRFTSSGLMLYLGLSRPVEGLLHHNVFFGDDFEGSFTDIFQKRRVPSDVSFYVSAPSRTGQGFAPPGKDALYVLVPVPHRDGTHDWSVEGPKVRAQVLARLAAEGYGDLTPWIEAERILTPDDWETDLNLSRGSNFGLSQSLFQLGPFRPKVSDPDIRQLYWCGASVQPGTGVPTVMLSAGFAVDAMLGELRS